MTYKLWVSLMDGPSPAEMAAAAREGKKNPKPACPKQVGNWEIMQESQITGDERTGRKSVLRFKASLSIPQCRWNFLRSQTVEQVESDEVDESKSDIATLDFGELLECIARCAVNKYQRCGDSNRGSGAQPSLPLLSPRSSALPLLQVPVVHGDVAALARPLHDDDGRRGAGFHQEHPRHRLGRDGDVGAHGDPRREV